MANEQKSNLPPSRQGKKPVTLWLQPEVHRQLKIVEAETTRTREELFREMLNWLFERHGKAPIA